MAEFVARHVGPRSVDSDRGLQDVVRRHRSGRQRISCMIAALRNFNELRVRRMARVLAPGCAYPEWPDGRGWRSPVGELHRLSFAVSGGEGRRRLALS